jgi:streptomycin 6-kinase
LDALAVEWGVTLIGVVPGGNMAVVVRCVRGDGCEAVLKVTPDSEVALLESSALECWMPTGLTPAVWASDSSRGAMLLEWIGDAVPVSATDATIEIEAVADLIRKVHRAELPARIGTRMPSLASRVDMVFAHWGRLRADSPAMSAAVTAQELTAGHRLGLGLATDRVAQVLPR